MLHLSGAEKFGVSSGRNRKGRSLLFSAGSGFALQERESSAAAPALLPGSFHTIKSPLVLPHAGSGILNVQSPEGQAGWRLTALRTLESPSTERKARQNADLRFWEALPLNTQTQRSHQSSVGRGNSSPEESLEENSFGLGVKMQVPKFHSPAPSHLFSPHAAWQKHLGFLKLNGQALFERKSSIGCRHIQHTGGQHVGIGQASRNLVRIPSPTTELQYDNHHLTLLFPAHRHLKHVALQTKDSLY